MLKIDHAKEHDQFQTICLALEAHYSGCELWSENPSRQPVRMDHGKFIDLLPMYLELTRAQPDHHYWISLPDPQSGLFPGAFGVRPKHYSFYQAVRDGNAVVTEIDDWVDYWHDTAWPFVDTDHPAKRKPSLREFLGFSRELYASFLKTNDAIMGLNTHGK